METDKITKQQKEIIFHIIKVEGCSITSLAKRAGIEKTRMWRLVNGLNEMTLSEYFSLVQILKSTNTLNIEKIMFLSGVN